MPFRLALTLGLLAVIPPAAYAAPMRDVVFAKVENQELRLNLFMPNGVESPPLVVYIHGGGWKNGSYKNCRVRWLTGHGFAVASVGYRLTDKAIFPAQIHDCKGAVRWLRAHAADYGYNATRIGVAGSSAGGHLALLVGVTAGNKVLEGEVGGNAEQSSSVQAIVDYFGPSDFVLRTRKQPAKTERRGGSVRLLLGGPASEKKELAKLASPAFHVTKMAPPLLMLHGEKDRVVNIRQSHRMLKAYEEAGLSATLQTVKGAGHGGRAFNAGDLNQKVAAFLKQHLLDASLRQVSVAQPAMAPRP